MKSLIQKFIPAFLMRAYHKTLSAVAAFWYGRPSEELVVIGVTGTNGKSTVVNLLARILEQAGFGVGFTSTVNFQVKKDNRLNDMKMTMPGRFFLQKMLRQMVQAGCKYAIIESTSEGILQFRHKNIHYDVMIFTNLAPEHLERHGGFENYKKAKLEYFRGLSVSRHKMFAGQAVPKVIVANLDDEFGAEFLAFPVDKKAGFTMRSKDDPAGSISGTEVVKATDVLLSASGSTFKISGLEFRISLPGKFNVENALAAVSTAMVLGVKLEVCRDALSQIQNVPGRMEKIEAGQSFQVLVDYAPEPNSLATVYKTLTSWPKRKLIHVLGSAGGGRDKSRRQVLGQMAGSTADVVIVTNEDPYDDDPQAIIDEIAKGAESVGKIAGEDLLKILDRRKAIRKALSLAQSGDLVLITGKGAEQAIVVANNKKIPWDDRTVVREELKKIITNDKSQTDNVSL